MSGAELLIAAAVVSAVGTMQRGQAAQSEAEAQARNSEREAAIVRDQAGQRSDRARRDGASREASARVRLAGSGARLEGSPLDVLGQMGSENELTALDETRVGELNAGRQLTRAASTRRRGSAARRQAMFNAGSSLLRGFA